ncbi:hypothetical protein ANN_19754 [Periplaneta americana]|uniref:Uncharacterized protein n=1 Tax=Periplaneta americana TaxID=6978 RepID=A0ABQ8SAR2_PERAM|nr:hypothetical protein ANN_19754 [Periplaneta americana]
MAGLCEGGSEPADSLNVICKSSAIDLEAGFKLQSHLSHFAIRLLKMQQTLNVNVQKCDNHIVLQKRR